jgi:hypothetical protein
VQGVARRDREWPIYLRGVAPTSGELPSRSLFVLRRRTDGGAKKRVTYCAERTRSPLDVHTAARKLFAWCQAFAISLLRAEHSAKGERCDLPSA